MDDLAFLDSISAQVKSLLYSLVQAAKGIGLYVNSDKTEFMCFNENGDISSLDDKPLKFVGQFKYHGTNITST